MHPSYVVGDPLRRADGSREESPTRSAFNRWVSECTCRRINQAQPRISAYLGRCPPPLYILEVITSVCEKTEKCLRYSQRKKKLIPENLGWFNSITAFFILFLFPTFPHEWAQFKLSFNLMLLSRTMLHYIVGEFQISLRVLNVDLSKRKSDEKTTRFPHSQTGVKFVLFILFYARIMRGATSCVFGAHFWDWNSC